MASEKKMYNAYGLFRVTTEGDCEGRTTRELGTHEGFIDEIAFALADQCFYTLQFKKIDKEKYKDRRPKGDAVNVSLDIESGTWNMKGNERVVAFREMFIDAGRSGFDIEPGQYFASVKLMRKKSPQEILDERRESGIAKIRKNLTTEEILALGLDV